MAGENVDPFAETASKRQIAACQSDYHKRRFNRVLVDESASYEFLEKEYSQPAECGHKRAITLLRLEKGSNVLRVRRVLEEKEERERGGDKGSMDLDRTPALPQNSRLPRS